MLNMFVLYNKFNERNDSQIRLAWLTGKSHVFLILHSHFYCQDFLALSQLRWNFDSHRITTPQQNCRASSRKYGSENRVIRKKFLVKLTKTNAFFSVYLIRIIFQVPLNLMSDVSLLKVPPALWHCITERIGQRKYSNAPPTIILFALIYPLRLFFNITPPLPAQNRWADTVRG